MSSKKEIKTVTFLVENEDEGAGGGNDESSESNKDEKPANNTYLMEFLRRSFGLSDPPEQVLSEISLEGVARYISSGKCKNIITMVGAGISTSAGIPDFRSPKSGLYFQTDENGQNEFKVAFDIKVFKENQQPFYNLAKKIWPGQSKPTPCHYFIRMLQERGLLLRHYTQNIDSLEFAAGIDPELMVEAHGTFRSSHCIYCDEPYRQDWIEERVFSDVIPICEDCNGPVKPDIVFFGNKLPDRFGECVETDFQKCDLLIILGTSLTVQPFASLTARVPETAPRLYINLSSAETGAKHPLMALFFGGGFKFEDDDNYRDIFWQGTTDDGCARLADLLGWRDELNEMITENTLRVEKEIAERQKAFAAYRAMAASRKSSLTSNKSGDQTIESIKNDSTESGVVQKSEVGKSDTKTSSTESKIKTSSAKANAATVKSKTTTTSPSCEKGKSGNSAGKSLTSSNKNLAALTSKAPGKGPVKAPVKIPITGGASKQPTTNPVKSQTGVSKDVSSQKSKTSVGVSKKKA